MFYFTWAVHLPERVNNTSALRRGEGLILGEDKNAFLVRDVPADASLVDQVRQQTLDLVDVHVRGRVQTLVQAHDELDGQARLLSLEHPAMAWAGRRWGNMRHKVEDW